jgi:hypothetical protein
MALPSSGFSSICNSILYLSAIVFLQVSFTSHALANDSLENFHDLTSSEIVEHMIDYEIGAEGIAAVVAAVEFAVLMLEDIQSTELENNPSEKPEIKVKETRTRITIKICNGGKCVTITYYKGPGNTIIQGDDFPSVIIVCRENGICEVKYGPVKLCTIFNEGGTTIIDCDFDLPFMDPVKETIKITTNNGGQICIEVNGESACYDPDTIPNDLRKYIPIIFPWLLPEFPWIPKEENEEKVPHGVEAFEVPQVENVDGSNYRESIQTLTVE